LSAVGEFQAVRSWPVKRDGAEINRVVNSTLRNLTVGHFCAAQETSRFTAALEVERFTTAPEVIVFWSHLNTGEALSRRGVQAIGPAVKIS
jgi:hypothetical protein